MKGTGNEKRGDVLFTSSLCVVTVLAVIFMLIGLLAADPITVLVGANAEVYDMTRTYLQVILLFFSMFMINNLLGAMIRNDGNTSLAMTAMLVDVCLILYLIISSYSRWDWDSSVRYLQRQLLRSSVY